MTAPVWKVAFALVLVVVLGASCAGGPQDSNVSIRNGVAYAGYNQVGITGDGDSWVYSVPSDVIWSDAAGTVHDGARPDCLPATGQTARVKFAATEVTVDGTTLRPVVWIFC